MEKLIRRYYEEVFNRGRVDVVDELLAPNYVNGSPAFPEQDRGRQGVKDVVQWLRATFADLHYEIEDIVEGRDSVAVRTTMTGKQNGLPFSVSQITIEKIEGGRIVSHHRVTDLQSLERQTSAR